MEDKNRTLSPSAKAFLVLMAKVKGKTPLEIMRDFNFHVKQQKHNDIQENLTMENMEAKNEDSK
ncbi:MAG: hypothetical protein KA807_12270 [Prolixibacteraceae bacterium]|nr:hypothetical protein [Prolixibacteraceae bacterium]